MNGELDNPLFKNNKKGESGKNNEEGVNGNEEGESGNDNEEEGDGNEEEQIKVNPYEIDINDIIEEELTKEEIEQTQKEYRK